MADAVHPLCCDCDDCLNGAGGYTLPGAGGTVPTPLTIVGRARGQLFAVTPEGRRIEVRELAQQRRYARPTKAVTRA